MLRRDFLIKEEIINYLKELEEVKIDIFKYNEPRKNLENNKRNKL